MKKFILITIFVVGFLIFVLLMEMLNVDHILVKLLNFNNNDMKISGKNKLQPVKGYETTNLIEKQKKE